MSIGNIHMYGTYDCFDKIIRLSIIPSSIAITYALPL